MKLKGDRMKTNTWGLRIAKSKRLKVNLEFWTQNRSPIPNYLDFFLFFLFFLNAAQAYQIKFNFLLYLELYRFR